MPKKIAIIGGSGVYDLFEGGKPIVVKTPYGKVENVSKITRKEKEIYFLPRHGPRHSVPPHLINYRANKKSTQQTLLDQLTIISTLEISSFRIS
jgi:5'-methylthioadenosine phosphorylase